MEIKTNNIPRLLENDSDAVKYKGDTYGLDEFMCTELEGWDGIAGQSAFHAVVIKLVDSDTVIMGSVFS